jgi:hypothetical protein
MYVNGWVLLGARLGLLAGNVISSLTWFRIDGANNDGANLCTTCYLTGALTDAGTADPGHDRPARPSARGSRRIG